MEYQAVKIAVVGTGAMGSVYAALLADAGNEVWAIDSWQAHVDAMNRDGLRVEGASGDRTVRVHASTEVADAGAVDLVIVATKARDVATAAASLAPVLRDDTPVLTIQNGLGAGERLAEHLPAGRILIGVAGGFGASMRGPGHAHHNGMQLIRLGEFAGGESARVERVAEAWRGAGFNVQVYPDIAQLVWEKFVCNVSFSGPCTVLERTVGEVLDDPDAGRVSIGCGIEAYNAGRARGVNFSFDDPEHYVRAFGSKIPNSRPSMLLDYLARRPSEIDAINGMVPRIAAEVGTAAPMNEAIVALVRAKERLAGIGG